MYKTKSLKEVKNDLITIFQTSNCSDLIRFYDYVADTNIYSKINKKVNENNYLDGKLRLAFEQIMEKAKPSLLFDLHNFIKNGKGNTRQFFEGIDREKAETLGKFGKAIKSILSKIENKGFELQVDVQPGDGLLTFEVEMTKDVTYMDFIELLYEEILNKEGCE